MNPLFEPLKLPCGQVLKNRLIKSAMSEILGTRDNGPSPNLSRAYKTWAQGGAGLLITGNIMVDRRALGEPNNVVIEDERHFPELKAWASSATAHGCPIWAQLNHPGKQSPSFLSSEPVAPSAIALGGTLKHFFKQPRALKTPEIEDIVKRFANAAAIAKKAGFSGVQIHGAHGYLVSQFLSPRHNQRTDKWGGSLENRMRFVESIYAAIRNQVGTAFPIGIKLNSADFLKDGLASDEAKQIVLRLGALGLDLIEISGGTYEAPAMMGGEQTSKREAYFADFCQDLKQSISTPLMLTGGFRTGSAMLSAINDGVCDAVGLARAFTLDPALPKHVAQNPDYRSLVRPLSTGSKAFDTLSMLNITYYEQQIARMGQGKDPDPSISPLCSVIRTFAGLGINAFRPRRG